MPDVIAKKAHKIKYPIDSFHILFVFAEHKNQDEFVKTIAEDISIVSDSENIKYYYGPSSAIITFKSTDSIQELHEYMGILFFSETIAAPGRKPEWISSGGSLPTSFCRDAAFVSAPPSTVTASSSRTMPPPWSAGASVRGPASSPPPPPLPSRTKWTRLVPRPVLTGHVSSLAPY